MPKKQTPASGSLHPPCSPCSPWSGVDWRKTDAVIAQEIGASGSLHPPCSPCSPWSGVDWRKTDAVIAQEIGASGSLHPPCSPCPVCADVRVRLKWHECSQLDGEHGLAAATMRGFERLLELETWPAKFRAEAAELRKANTPKATGGAIVYEDIAAAIGQLLKPNDNGLARRVPDSE